MMWQQAEIFLQVAIIAQEVTKMPPYCLRFTIRLIYVLGVYTARRGLSLSKAGLVTVLG